MSLLERVRPSWSAPTLAQQRTSAYLPGALAGLRAVGVSFVVVVVPLLAVWATAAHVTTSWVQALRISASGWLLLHHVAVAYPGGDLGLVPLGLTLVPILASYRSGRRLAMDPLLSQGFSASTVNFRPLVQGLAGLAAAYAGVAVLVALIATSTAVHPVVWQAPIGPAVIAALAGSVGVLRGHPRGADLRAQLFGWVPGRVRSAVRPALAAVVVLLLLALALLVVALLVAGSRVLALHRALQPGVSGGALLIVGQLAYLPDLAGWALSWLAGPGFAVGTGTVVSAGQVHLGVLPVIPVFGALPGSSLRAGWMVALAAAGPVVAGAVAGWWSARPGALAKPGGGGGGGAADEPVERTPLGSRLLESSMAALAAALTATLVLGLLIALSAGSIGPGRLAQVGPNALVVSAFLAVELVVGALGATAVRTWWLGRR
jgi:Family of unknown function (DUF6350)